MILLTTLGALTAQLELGKYSVEMPWYLLILGTALFAFSITNTVIPSIITFSRTKNLFDTPNQRTSHTSAVPTLGGAAVFLGMILPATFYGTMAFDHEFKFIMAGLLILFFTGIKDDVLVISAKTKLLAEIFAILIVVMVGNIRVTGFHGFLGIHEVPYYISVLFTVFMFIVVINGFNLIDGIDGLASGVGMISISGLGVWFVLSGNLPYAAFSFTTVAALAAFFRFNVFSKKNKIFLGDTGSLIIGMIVSIFTIRFLEGSLTHPLGMRVVSAPAIAIGLLIVPLIDTLRVFTLRIMSGRSPFKPDRLHIHHKLLELGLNHIQSTSLILLFNLAILGLALIFRYLGNIKVLFIILPVAGFVTSVPGLVIRYKRMRTVEDENREEVSTWVVPDTIMNMAREMHKTELASLTPPVNGIQTALDDMKLGILDESESMEEVDAEVYLD